MPKFALHAATIPGAPLEAQLKVTKDAGFSGFAFWNDHVLAGSVESQRQSFAQILGSGLDVAEVQYIGDWTAVPPEGEAELAAKTRALALTASRAGCDLICAPTFGQSAPADVAARNFRLICRTAADFNVRVGMEFLPWTHIADLDSAQRILEMADEKNGGLIIDTFHFFFGGSKLSSLEKLDPKTIFIVHLSDIAQAVDPRYGPEEIINLTLTSRIFPGTGQFPLVPFIRCLERIGYDGYYLLEVLNTSHQTADPLSVARQGIQSVETLFRSAHSEDR